MAERSAPAVLHRRHTSRPSGLVVVKVKPLDAKIFCRVWASVKEVKQRLQEGHGVRVAWARLFHNDVELHDTTRLNDLIASQRTGRSLGSKTSSLGTNLFALSSGSASSSSASSSSRPGASLVFELRVQNPHAMTKDTYMIQWGSSTVEDGEAARRLLAGVQQGLALGLAPQLSLEGTGGTYLMRDALQQPLACFKPRDEEPFAPNNPRGLCGKLGQVGIHPHILSGESVVREVLAYQLDHRGFADVPCTSLVEARHPVFNHPQWDFSGLSSYGAKVGSLQQWVAHADVASNFGASTFPVAEVHKLAALDLRLLNTDRNDANVLVVDGGGGGGPKLVPIDHGGCLPLRPQVAWFGWCWLEWPQLSSPLSPELKAYVASLDVDAEARLFARHALPAAAARVSRCATRLLQLGVAAGLNLREVARLMCREDEERESELEKLWEHATRLALSMQRNPRLAAERRERSSNNAERNSGDAEPNGDLRSPPRGGGAAGGVPPVAGLKRCFSESAALSTLSQPCRRCPNRAPTATTTATATAAGRSSRRARRVGGGRGGLPRTSNASPRRPCSGRRAARRGAADAAAPPRASPTGRGVLSPKSLSLGDSAADAAVAESGRSDEGTDGDSPPSRPPPVKAADDADANPDAEASAGGEAPPAAAAAAAAGGARSPTRPSSRPTAGAATPLPRPSVPFGPAHAADLRLSHPLCLHESPMPGPRGARAFFALGRAPHARAMMNSAPRLFLSRSSRPDVAIKSSLSS